MCKKKIRLFLVENHTLVRASLKTLLHEEPDMIVVGESEAIERIDTKIEQSDPDVLLLDLSLPGKSGVDAVQMMHKKYGSMPILVLTMQDATLYAAPCIRAGAKGFVTKDASPEVLLSAIRKLNEGGTYLSESASDGITKMLSTQGALPPHESLSPREYEIMIMHSQGLTGSAIAKKYTWL